MCWGGYYRRETPSIQGKEDSLRRRKGVQTVGGGPRENNSPAFIFLWSSSDYSWPEYTVDHGLQAELLRLTRTEGTHPAKQTAMLSKLPNCMFLGLLGLEVGKWLSLTEKLSDFLSDWAFTYIYNCLAVQLCLTLCDPWTVACQASRSITNSQSLLKLMSIESVMPSNHLILCHPLLLPPSIFPSIRVFSNESVLCIRWPK